ncbi:MAG: hypothetical protein KGL39_09580 [Patescibacteria group bacterium]|nr:hypothetical protein [Patescibacteria group bacterium]
MLQVTPAELAHAHHVRYQDGMLRAWMNRTGRRNSYHPSEVPAHIEQVTNDDRSRAERIEFISRPLPHGATYTAYLSADKARITTFTGETLAYVTGIHSRKDYRAWLTNERGSFWAEGIDGRVYYGRHNGAGVYCRMRLAKHQRSK